MSQATPRLPSTRCTLFWPHALSDGLRRGHRNATPRDKILPSDTHLRTQVRHPLPPILLMLGWRISESVVVVAGYVDPAYELWFIRRELKNRLEASKTKMKMRMRRVAPQEIGFEDALRRINSIQFLGEIHVQLTENSDGTRSPKFSEKNRVPQAQALDDVGDFSDLYSEVHECNSPTRASSHDRDSKGELHCSGCAASLAKQNDPASAFPRSAKQSTKAVPPKSTLKNSRDAVTNEDGLLSDMWLIATLVSSELEERNPDTSTRTPPTGSSHSGIKSLVMYCCGYRCVRFMYCILVFDSSVKLQPSLFGGCGEDLNCAHIVMEWCLEAQDRMDTQKKPSLRHSWFSPKRASSSCPAKDKASEPLLRNKNVSNKIKKVTECDSVRNEPWTQDTSQPPPASLCTTLPGRTVTFLRRASFLQCVSWRMERLLRSPLQTIIHHEIVDILFGWLALYLCNIPFQNPFQDAVAPNIRTVRIANIPAMIFTRVLSDIEWFREAPASVKMNDDLNNTMSTISLTCLSKVSEYLVMDGVDRGLSYLVITAALVGASTLCSMSSDLLRVLFFPIAVIHYALKFLFRIMARILMAYARSFTGKKKNPLRDNRIDNFPLEMDRVLLGTVLFACLCFLFPTLLWHHTYFTAVTFSLDILYQLLHLLSIAMVQNPGLWNFLVFLFASPTSENVSTVRLEVQTRRLCATDRTRKPSPQTLSLCDIDPHHVVIHSVPTVTWRRNGSHRCVTLLQSMQKECSQLLKRIKQCYV